MSKPSWKKYASGRSARQNGWRGGSGGQGNGNKEIIITNLSAYDGDTVALKAALKQMEKNPSKGGLSTAEAREVALKFGIDAPKNASKIQIVDNIDNYFRSEFGRPSSKQSVIAYKNPPSKPRLSQAANSGATKKQIIKKLESFSGRLDTVAFKAALKQVEKNPSRGGLSRSQTMEIAAHFKINVPKNASKLEIVDEIDNHFRSR